MGRQARLQGNRGRFVGRAGRRTYRGSDETHAIFRADGEPIEELLLAYFGAMFG